MATGPKEECLYGLVACGSEGIAVNPTGASIIFKNSGESYKVKQNPSILEILGDSQGFLEAVHGITN